MGTLHLLGPSKLPLLLLRGMRQRQSRYRHLSRLIPIETLFESRRWACRRRREQSWRAGKPQGGGGRASPEQR
jgi:hypothetical protein